MKRILMAAAILGALASTSAADRADDDLAAVKKAVGTTVQAQAVEREAKPPAEEPAPSRAEKARAQERRAEETRVAEKPRSEGHDRRAADRPRSRKGEPQWFRVRIAEKGEKHARVSVNLPLDLVRAFGANLDLDDDCLGHHTIGEVLRVLDSGESLVDIEDEDATVHVWVE
jgi:hypothetical protein